jgi:DNA-binding MarR family transcriptional regulator
VRFINLMRAIEVLPSGMTLDPQEERLMQELALHWSRGESVTVLSAMNMLAGASPSTVQRRLKTLRSKGLLSFEPSAQDARVRHVVATEQGQAYFTRMGELMREAVDRV